MTGEILILPITDIEIGERIGFFHADHVIGLAASMAEHGQTTPIHVRHNPAGMVKPWRLVAGRHRIGAAETLGWLEIQAIEVADASASDETLLRLELSENLDHRSPRPLERAVFIDARARLEEALDYPNAVGEVSQVRAGRARQAANEIVSPAKNWRERTSTAFGISLRTIELYREIHRAIVAPFPDLAERLNFHQIGERFSYIHGIAKLEREETRRKVIETIIADPELDGLKSALIKCGVQLSNGNRTLPHDRATVSFRTGWARMTLLQQEANAAMLAKEAHLQVARRMYAELKKRRGIEGGGNG